MVSSSGLRRETGETELPRRVVGSPVAEWPLHKRRRSAQAARQQQQPLTAHGLLVGQRDAPVRAELEPFTPLQYWYIILYTTVYFGILFACECAQKQAKRRPYTAL
jgi:hypothetical protein